MKNVLIIIFLSVASVTQAQMFLAAKVNAPKSLRQGDSIEIPVKLFNNSGQALEGSVSFMLTDSLHGSLDKSFQNNSSVRSYSITGGDSVLMYFAVTVPGDIQLSKIRYAVIGTNDTLKSGYIPLLSYQKVKTAGKYYQGKTELSILRNKKPEIISESTELYVGDTIIITGMTDIYDRFSTIESSFKIPANTISTSVKPVYKMNGNKSETKITVVISHAGECSVDGSYITVDGKRMFLPMPYTIRSLKK